MDEKSLLAQIDQQKKDYAILMDQFNELQAEKNNLQAELKIARIDREAVKEHKDDWESKYVELKRRFDICKAHGEDKEKNISDLQEQCSIRYETIERLNGEKKQLEEVIKDRTKDVQHYDEENKKLMEKLDVAERELEKEIRTLEMESDARAYAQRQYEEIKLKNQNICSSIADLVRKVMQD